MNGFRLVLIIGLWFSLMNGLNLSYGAGDVTTAGRLAITSSSAEASSGSKPFLNAKDYGVVGDGANNDMPAIITLLAGSLCTSGCHIHFPAGIYVVWRGENAAPNIVTDNVTISGDGPATIFRGRDVTGSIPNDRGFPRWNIFTITNNHHFRLQDLAFDGYLTLLYARHANDITVSNIHGEGLIPNNGHWLMQMGMFFADNQGVRISDCTFHNFNDAIYLSAFLTAPDPPYDPITPQTVRDAIITNNHFENTVAAGGYAATYPVGVYVFYAKDTIIANNIFTNIYSSTSNGTYASGMGYSVYDGDGVSTGLTIANNSFNFTGNGATKNATAILVGSDSNTIIRGNNIRSINGRLVYAIRAFRSVTSTTAEPVANRLIANNVIHVTETDTLTDHYGIWLTSSPAALSNIEISGNTIVGNWNTGIKVESEELARVQVLNNLIIGGVLRQIHLLGVGTRSMQQARVAGNRLLNGQTQGITLQYAVGTIVENNTILDGNLSNCGSLCEAAIEGQGNTSGMIIRNNIIGNTPAGGGLYKVASRYPANATNNAIFKAIVYNNNLIGINNGTASWTYFPTASPTNGFYDADYGDIIYNSTLAAGGVPGWVCTKATRTPLTASASSASTTVTVASTSGYAAGDLVMLVKQADMYSELYDSTANWHTTTIASVTNATTFVLTAAIPAGDGTYVSGTAQLKRAVFKPLPAIGS